ncbi:MAG TPA: histidine kinase [Anaerolineales bacterium]|nr:histidine kinase [Anaerolineales bacterium]
MRPTSTTILSDRITLTIRWLVLVGLVLGLSLNGGVSSIGIWLVSLAGVWNIFLIIFTIIGRRLWQHTYVTVVVDVVLGLLLTLLAIPGGAPYVWAGLLPIFTAGFYFGLQGGFTMATVVILLQGIVMTVQMGNTGAMNAIWRPALFEMLAGLVFGLIAQQVNYLIRHQHDLERSRQKDKEKEESNRIKTLYQLTSAMTATLNYQRVLDMALDQTAKAVTAPGDENKLVSAFFLFEADSLVVGSARRFTPSDLRAVLPGKSGVIADTLNSGQPRLIYTPKEDPEIRRLIAMRECGVVYCYPLRAAAEMFGVLMFGHPEATYFDETNCEIMDVVGRQALVALQNAQLYRNLELEKERMMEIQEEARKQLARDLHDGPTQSVAAIAMRVNFARRLIDRDAQAAGDELFKIEDLARRTTKEIRHMLFTLRPLVLETNGLVAALESMAEKMAETYGQKVTISAAKAAIDDLELGKQGVIFYIAEEAVNNARKHAEAEEIKVIMQKPNADVVILEIQDNGVGFNVGEVDAGYEKRGSLGMVNMRERTELVNGVLQLQSKVGEGTRIRVLVPLNEDAAEKLRSGTFR